MSDLANNDLSNLTEQEKESFFLLLSKLSGKEVDCNLESLIVENEKLKKRILHLGTISVANGTKVKELEIVVDGLEVKICFLEKENTLLKEREESIIEKTEKEAWAEANEQYETRINQLVRELEEANSKFITELDSAVEEKFNELVQHKKKVLDDLDNKSKLAQANSKRAYEAMLRSQEELVSIKVIIEKYREGMTKFSVGEAETASQIAVAEILIKPIGEAMAELLTLEHKPQKAAVPKIKKVSEMCLQMSQALTSFLDQGNDGELNVRDQA